MEVKALLITNCSATFEFENAFAYEMPISYSVYLNGNLIIENNLLNVFSVFDLKAGTSYELQIRGENGDVFDLSFCTIRSSYVINVKKFGAVGDGIHEDTAAIQAAIMACPEDSKIVIPKGIYLCAPLFLKSNITIELCEGAILMGHPDRAKYSVLPGYIMAENEVDELLLGTWEGNPLDMFASLITGIGVKNVTLTGKGILDGNGSGGDWWLYPKDKIGAYRPRIIFLNQCENITLQGVTVKNSPCWTIHPYFSKQIKIIDLKIENDKDSPNTDGIDPESCEGVDIIGTHFSVGDDCIAIKSGKLYMGMRYQKPSQNLEIRNCIMKYGHGAVVIGSEMSGGVKHVNVERCVFYHTDRGLRIKTRRGRGKYAIVENVTFNNIVMKNVLTPFVINMFYFCDPDGKSEYVWSKEKWPVDEWTPHLGTFKFTNVACEDSEWAAGYFAGLPELPIDEIVLENVHVRFKAQASQGIPAMMTGLNPVSKQGFTFYNVKRIRMNQTSVTGAETDMLLVSGENETIINGGEDHGSN